MANDSLFVRKIIKQCLLEYLSAQTPLDRVLNETLREHRVGSQQRSEISDTVYKCTRFWNTLYQTQKFHPEKIADQRILEAGIERAHKLTREELFKLHEQAKPRFEKDSQNHLSGLHGVPDALMSEFYRLDEPQKSAYHQYLHQSIEEAPVTIRWNPKKITIEGIREALGDVLVQAHPFLEGCGYLEKRVNLRQHSLFEEGLVDFQDESSQLVTRLCLAQPGEKILDLCAGAGGKSLHLSEMMERQGEIFAYDVSKVKLAELVKRARRQNISNIRVLDQLPTHETFDLILVDAPCSGLGVLRRNPERLARIHSAELRRWEKVQAEVLDWAVRHLNKNGRLVYATCTLRDQENAAQVYQVVQSANREWQSVDLQFQKTFGKIEGDELLTLLRQTPAARMSEHKSPGFLQWGPSHLSQASGAWRGDGFFVSLVK